MTWSNFHSHSEFCDGKHSLDQYAAQALQLGMTSLGFSGHAPLPFPCRWCMKSEDTELYLSSIRQLKHQYDGDLQLYAGLEVDYVPGHTSPVHFRINKLNLDYTIGSIHFVDFFDSGEPWEVDGSFSVFKLGLQEIFRGDVKRAVQRYFALTREMIDNFTPSIVGHLDKIKIHNQHLRLFSEQDSWYQREIDATLESLSRSGAILEVNTRGIYTKKSFEAYPGNHILEGAFQREIPITLSSDAHHPKDLIRLFPEAAKTLKKIGYTSIRTLQDNKWVDQPLGNFY